MSESITKQTTVAAKWSTITEIAAKCITPITSMILARILAPDAFGVLATVTMVISFAEVFVDSGFQKYLIQHNFKTKKEEEEYISVAFWANLGVSLILWLIIFFTNEPIASLVGNPGKGHVLAISGIMIPLYGMIGIQTCKLKKDLNFKKLFYVRITSSLVPLIITIPLALLGLDYWALVIGNIAGICVQSVVLLCIKSFIPHFFFSFDQLKEMLSYGIWTILNGFAIWLTSWFDAFLIGRALSEYYLGLYKNSTALINSIFSMVTASIVPVLFSSLAKLQNDNFKFRKMYLAIQRLVACFLLPLGVGIFLYNDFATNIFLGAQWLEASKIIGITAITVALRTIYVGLNGDVFRAKGEFKVPLALQVVDLFFTIPLCYWSLAKGFWLFVLVRSLSRLFLIIPEFYYMDKVCQISARDQLKAHSHYYISTLIMMVFSLLIKSIVPFEYSNYLGVGICIIVYFSVLLLFKEERQIITNLYYYVLKKGKLK